MFLFIEVLFCHNLIYYLILTISFKMIISSTILQVLEYSFFPFNTVMASYVTKAKSER